MTNNWPLIQNHNHSKIATKDSIVILYYPLTGGEFLANVLSCCDEFYGSKYFNSLQNFYKPIEKDWLDGYENNHHKKIFPAHARYHTFNEWLKYDKIIYIDFTLSKKEIDWLTFRKKFINNSVSDPYNSDLQFKYEKELIRFFVESNKKYFTFPLESFLNDKDFAIKVNDCISYLTLSPLGSKNVKRLWKYWMSANLKLGKKYE